MEQSWDDTDELPTKFNKYRRLKAKEAAQAQTSKNDSEGNVTIQSASTTDSSNLSSPLVMKPKSEQLLLQQQQQQQQLTNIQLQQLNIGPVFSSQPTDNANYIKQEHVDVARASQSIWIPVPRNDGHSTSPSPAEERMDCSPVGSQSLDSSVLWGQRQNGSVHDFNVTSQRPTTDSENSALSSEERVCRSPRMSRTDNSPYRSQYDRSPHSGQRSRLTHHHSARASRIDGEPPRRLASSSFSQFGGRMSAATSGLGSCPILDVSSLAAIGTGICRCGSCRQCLSSFRTSSSSGSFPLSTGVAELPFCNQPLMSTGTVEAPLDLTSRASDQRQAVRAVVAQRTVLTSEGSSSKVVDEHFERSLGAKYRQLLKYPTAPSSAPPQSTPSVASGAGASGAADSGTSHISVTGSVDDHFSKSLGPVWRQMYENTGAAGPTDTSSAAAAARMEMASEGSVDDHFAKALGGETWQRIKAEQKEELAARSTSVPLSNNHDKFFQT